MTQDQIIEMARQVASHGVEDHRSGEVSYVFYNEHLVNFAKLIAEFERSNNALLCYEQRKHWDALVCADAIRAGTRARGQS